MSIIPDRIDLPSGGWVTFRDPTTVSARARKKMLTAMMSAIPAGVTIDTSPDESKEQIAQRVGTAVTTAMLGAGGGDSLTKAMGVNEVAAAALITEWHIPYSPDLDDVVYPPGEVPIPKTDPNVMDGLETRDYDTIIRTITPATNLLMRDLSASPDQAGEPGSPTVPAGGSEPN